jgi:hypothetical protein
MLAIRCGTAFFHGAGNVHCRNCGRRTPVAPGTPLVLISFTDVTVVRSAETGSVLHDCRLNRAERAKKD